MRFLRATARVLAAVREAYPMLHSPKFVYADAAVAVGIRMMAELAVGWIGRDGVR